MSFFSRLTDIVTCNLSELLAQAEDPRLAIDQIIREMDEGLAGAKRSVASAHASEDRLFREIQDHQSQVLDWGEKARDSLKQGRDNDARHALIRRREIEDLVAGLEQQHQAAVATREHLSTMHRALEARHAEALRRRAILDGCVEPEHAHVASSASHPAEDERLSQIDAELEALKRELGR